MRKTAIALSTILAACAPPVWRPPAVEVPPAFREVGRDSAAHRLFAPDTGGGAVARGGVAAPARVSDGFWRELGDTTLSRMVDQALAANLDIRAAEARLRGARAARAGAALDLAPPV